MKGEETVKGFEERVKGECKAHGLNSFKIHSETLKTQTELKLQDLMKSKFQIEVNGSKKYDVYPQFETMVEQPSGEAVKVIERAFEGRSIPISRRVILYHYFDSMLRNLKGFGTTTKFTDADIHSALQAGLADYTKEYTSRIYANPLVQLQHAEQEL